LNIGVDRQRSDCAGHTVTLSRTLIAGWREKIMQTKIITFEKKVFFCFICRRRFGNEKVLDYNGLCSGEK